MDRRRVDVRKERRDEEWRVIELQFIHEVRYGGSRR